MISNVFQIAEVNLHLLLVGIFRVLKQAAINENKQLRPCLLSFSGLAQGTFKAAPKTPMTTTGTAKIEMASKQHRKWHGQIGMR